jgi:hypothetical protein
MRRTDTHIQREDLADLYSGLRYFSKYYDDAEDAVKTVMTAIRDVYIQEYGESPDDADRYLRNRRGAGRKSTLHPEDIACMKRMRAEGISVKNIASEYGISTVHVYSLLRK